MPIIARSDITSANQYPNFQRAVPNASISNSDVDKPLEEFIGLATIRKVRKGDYIYSQTTKVSSVYLVKSGSIKLGIHAASGKEMTKAVLVDGDVFGEKAILSQKLNKEYAIARELSEVYEFKSDGVHKLIQQHPRLLMYFVNIIGQRSLIMEKRLESLVFNDSRTRVIDFLLDLAARRGKQVGFETLINKVMTHQEVANHTATSRQTVTTLLNELRNENILTFNRRRILIRDLGKLARAKNIN